MAARNFHPGELFRRYDLPVISAEQNGSESEEINTIGKSQAEDRPVNVCSPKRFFVRHLVRCA